MQTSQVFAQQVTISHLTLISKLATAAVELWVPATVCILDMSSTYYYYYYCLVKGSKMHTIYVTQVFCIHTGTNNIPSSNKELRFYNKQLNITIYSQL